VLFATVESQFEVEIFSLTQIVISAAFANQEDAFAQEMKIREYR
jgi:hypothetical protein